MSLPQLPKIIAAFVRAANARDTAGLLEIMTGDAVVTDAGQPLSGDGLRRWSDDLFVGCSLAVRPFEVTVRDGSTVVSVVLHGRKPGARTHIRRDWRFTVAGSRIAALEMTKAAEPALPSLVAAFVEATNAGDLEGLMAVFAEDAMVNDDLREHWGKARIRTWADQEFIGQRVAIFVVKCIARHAIAVVTAHVDGHFDQRGLPYPLVLTFYFSSDCGEIVQLIVLRNQPD